MGKFEKILYPTGAILPGIVTAKALLSDLSIAAKLLFLGTFGIISVGYAFATFLEYTGKFSRENCDYNIKNIATAASAIENMERTYL